MKTEFFYGRNATTAVLLAAVVAFVFGLESEGFSQAQFREFPERDLPFQSKVVGLDRVSFGHQQPQTVATEGVRLAVMAGYHYWPQANFENSAVEAGYMLERRTVGGPLAALAFGYRAARDWDVAIEIGYTRESIRFESGTTAHSTVPLIFMARWIPWPGGVEPYFGLGFGYVLNFYSGGIMEYEESHSMGAVADVGLFIPLTSQLALLAEVKFTYAISEMNPPFKDRMGGGLGLVVGIQWGMKAGGMGLY